MSAEPPFLLRLPQDALDATCRAGYRAAYQGLRLWWRIGPARPSKRGALVALWQGGRILLVKQSYRRALTLPGGYGHPGEDPKQTARRELKEETGIALDTSSFGLSYENTRRFEDHLNTVFIFEVSLAQEPLLRVDRREIAWGNFFTPQEALSFFIDPQVRSYLGARQGPPASLEVKAPPLG